MSRIRSKFRRPQQSRISRLVCYGRVPPLAPPPRQRDINPNSKLHCKQHLHLGLRRHLSPIPTHPGHSSIHAEMPRKLPWARAENEPSLPPIKTESPRNVKRKSPSSHSTPPRPKRVAQPHSGLLNRTRSPSTSPPPEPPKEQ